MENLPRDVLISTVMDLDLYEILALCETSTRMNELLCGSDEFWKRKLFKDFKLTSKNPKQIYSRIVQNRKFCSQLVESKYFDNTTTFIEMLPNFFNETSSLSSGDVVIFNYLVDKYLKRGIGLPNYFEMTYDRYIGQHAANYNNRIVRGKTFTEEEMIVLRELISKFRSLIPVMIEDNRSHQFFISVLDRFLAGTIPLEVKFPDLCKYPIY